MFFAQKKLLKTLNKIKGAGSSEQEILNLCNLT